jgi:hypothetical protein
MWRYHFHTWESKHFASLGHGSWQNRVAHVRTPPFANQAPIFQQLGPGSHWKWSHNIAQEGSVFNGLWTQSHVVENGSLCEGCGAESDFHSIIAGQEVSFMYRIDNLAGDHWGNCFYFHCTVMYHHLGQYHHLGRWPFSASPLVFRPRSFFQCKVICLRYTVV